MSGHFQCRHTFNSITLLPRFNCLSIWLQIFPFNTTKTKQAFRWWHCRHKFLNITLAKIGVYLPLGFLSERSQIALGSISVPGGLKKRWSSLVIVSSVWATLETSVMAFLMRWRECSRLFLDALPHSSDSSGPVGIGTETEGGGREG